MQPLGEYAIKLLLIFLITPLFGVLCGIFSNFLARIKLKEYKENFSQKFASNILFGFLLILLDFAFWIGNLSLITIVLINYGFTLSRMLAFIPIWYLFIYFLSRTGFDHFFGKPLPKSYLRIENSTIEKGYHEIFNTLETNLNTPLGKLNFRWAMPAGKFMACYLWDSAFISFVWKYLNKEIAGEILLSLLDNQSKDGQIPHFVSIFHKSDKTQPPLLAWAISNLDVDIDYLKQAYPRLKNYNQWLYKNRRLPNGLFFWQHSYESGIDNSPRFTDRSEKQKYDLTQRSAIDLNSYIVLQNRALIKIAKKLQKQTDETYEEDIADFEQKNTELIELIQNFLWDEKVGLFFDYDIATEKRININTIASFIPLIAEIPTETQLKRLIEHLENPEEYNTLIPLPTVALNDKNFEKDTWRGPVWVNTAYLIIKGLEKYQKHELSSEFAYRLIKGIFETWHNEGSFYEFYDPERFDLKELTRKKGNLFKQITLGGKPVKHFVGWTGLVNSLLIETVIGYDLLEKTIQPRLTKELKGQTIVLGLVTESLELKIEYHDAQNISITIIDLTGQKPSITKKCSLYQKISLADFLK